MSSTSFNRSLLALAITTAISSPIALAEETPNGASSQDVEVIQVKGIRSSLKESLATKRLSNSIVDSITAEDIGKLPDVTISDSLQRVPGIQITRSAGEGARVNVRGTPQVGMLLNGEQMLSAGNITTVQPNFSDIPASLVQKVDVIKSPTADILSGGISGTINLKSLRPFNLKEGVNVIGSLEGTRGTMSDETDHRASVVVGLNADDFGFLVNASTSSSNLANYSLGAAGNNWWRVAQEGGKFGFYGAKADINGDGAVDENDISDYSGDGDDNDLFLVFQGHNTLNRFLNRDRDALNASFQWQLTDSLRFTSDVFYTNMDERMHSMGLAAAAQWGKFGWYLPDMEYASIYDDVQNPAENAGELITLNKVTLLPRDLKSQSNSSFNQRESINTNFQLDYEGDSVDLSLRYLHGEADGHLTKAVVDARLGQEGTYVRPGVNISANPGGYPGGPAIGSDGEPLLKADGTPLLNVYPDPAKGLISVDYRGKYQHWHLPTIDGEKLGENLDRYGFNSTNSGDNYDESAEIDVLRFDGSWLIDSGDLSTIDFGVRYGEREVARDYYNYAGVFTSPETGQEFIARWHDVNSKFKDSNGKNWSYFEQHSLSDLQEMDPSLIVEVDDFGPAKGLGTYYAVNPEHLDDPKTWLDRWNGGNTVKFDIPDQSYEVKESNQSAFLQANLEGDLFNLGYGANLGLRVVKTTLETTQSMKGSKSDPEIIDGKAYLRGPGIKEGFELDDEGNRLYLVTENSYTDYLPTFNAWLDITENQKLRFSVAKTMTNHNTNQLGLGLTVTRLRSDTDDSLFLASSAKAIGNPMLEPWRSTNFDLSWEWYFNETGYFSAAAFLMKIDSFITSDIVIRDDIPDSDGVVRNEALAVQTTVNGDGGDIKGLELSYQQTFDFLPSFLSGLGTALNYTYAPSDSDSTDYFGNKLPMNDNSEHQANAILFYDKDGFQFRVAYNYRSKKLNNSVKVQDQDNKGLLRNFAYWTKPTHYVDVSASYDLAENLTLYLTGSNVTEEYVERYVQWEHLREQQDINEARYSLGIRGKF